jgi:hypothetical protein
MLLSVGMELGINPIAVDDNVKPSKDDEDNDDNNQNKDENTLKTPGGLWTRGIGRRKRCRHDRNVGGKLACGVGCDSEWDGKEEGKGQEEGDGRMAIEDASEGDNKQTKEEREKKEAVLKKMREGLIDPSKAISNPISDPSSSSESNKTKLKRLLQLILLADVVRGDPDPNVNLSPSTSSSKKLFDTVKLNSDHTKLIFRDLMGSEAFCFIVFDGSNDSNNGSDSNDSDSDSNALHNAVVQSEDENFRQTVIQALKLLAH